MANVMMAAYPETFAAGTIIAGLPFGIAHSIPEAFQAMRSGRPLARSALGAFVRDANPGNDKWPAVSVWHGTADRTVDPTNGEAVVTQWLDVRGLPNEPTRVETVDGQTRSVWCDTDGRVIVEAFSIAGMGHGTPLNPAMNAGEVAGAFMLDAGISSTLHSARSWGLVADDGAASVQSRAESPSSAARPTGAAETQGTASSPAPHPRRGSINVGQVINNALRSAGLLR